VLWDARIHLHARPNPNEIHFTVQSSLESAIASTVVEERECTTLVRERVYHFRSKHVTMKVEATSDDQLMKIGGIRSEFSRQRAASQAAPPTGTARAHARHSKGAVLISSSEPLPCTDHAVVRSMSSIMPWFPLQRPQARSPRPQEGDNPLVPRLRGPRLPHERGASARLYPPGWMSANWLASC